MAAENRSSSGDPRMADVLSPALGFDLGQIDQMHHALQKRKRQLDDLNEDAATRDSKRRSFHALPIRLCPSTRPAIAIPNPNQFSTFTSIYQQPPTPVDTSEDESPNLPPSDPQRLNLPSGITASQSSSSSSLMSLKHPFGETLDVDMDISLSSSMPRVRRARSNDIIPPHRELLGALEGFPRDRVPTPISSHFDSWLSDKPAAPRHSYPPIRTNLSPMIEQESWISRDGLPSPVEDTPMEGVMMMDEASDGMNGLSVDENAQSVVTESPTRRTARLHMGYLSGCEKCEQKVPGHYSHILWS